MIRTINTIWGKIKVASIKSMNPNDIYIIDRSKLGNLEIKIPTVMTVTFQPREK